MTFDTHAPIEVLDAVSGSGARPNAVRRAVQALTGPVSGGPQAEPVDASDAQLLAHLDTVFQPLLDAARATAVVACDAATLSPAQRLLAEQQAERARDLQAVAAFKAREVHQPHASRPSDRGPAHGGIPSRLLSASRRSDEALHIGLEYQADRLRLVLFGASGRNHEVSVTLCGAAPGLAELLARLLDEAEQRGLLKHWPQDIVLLGLALHDDLADFAEAEELLAALGDGASPTLTWSLPLPPGARLALATAGPVRLHLRDAARAGGQGMTLRQIGRSLAAPKPKGPRVGLGPRVYVGFDAEWAESRKGRNRIISVQFVLYGPSGETFERLFDLAGDHNIDQRLTLADALDVLLDEAEQACVFEHWPCEIVLLGFFLRGDLTAFADFDHLRPQLDGIGGTMGTVIRPATVTLPMDTARQERLKSRYQQVVDDGFDPRLMKVRILDVSRLTPPGTSLAKVGKWLGEPKIELPTGYTKSDMLRFKRQEPEKFRAYALHDARLAVLYGLWVLWFSDRQLGLKGLSATVSGLAVRLAELCMRRDGVHPDVALNFEWVSRQAWSDRRQRLLVRKDRVPVKVRGWLQPFLADVYQGGRNESYVFGPSEVGRWYDSDLAGAYVTGLAVFMALDYAQVLQTKDVQEFVGPVAGFAHVRFRFPAGTRFPCLPVQVGMGLWFPLEGTSLCTAPEIELALAMGAELQIRHGIVIGWKARAQVFEQSSERLRQWQASQDKQLQLLQAGRIEVGEGSEGLQDVLVAPEAMRFPPPDHGDVGYRPMESFAIFVRQQRLRYRRKTLPFEFMKLTGNGLYGKTGQGLKDKRGTRLKDLESVPIGPSRVSEAAIAALVCGFVRATVSEILWKLPPEARVVSLTTDGALMDVPTEQLDLSGAICRRFQALVDRVAPGTSMIEPKHQVRQVFVPRTRGCFTVEPDVDEAGKPHPLMCAKAGHKVVIPENASDEERERLHSDAGASDWMIRLALGRTPGQTLEQESFFSLREQLANHWDLQMQVREVKVALEYDFKRRPVNPRMVRMDPYDAEHLAFDTEPWQSAAEGEVVRELFRSWRERNCLKTLEDWRRWQVFLNHHQGNRQRRAKGPTAGTAAPGSRSLRGGTGQKHLRGGEAGLLRLVVRTFLAAFTQGLWGLEGEIGVWTYKGLARWLTGLGYPVSENDVKNARRSRVDEGIAVETPEIRRFLDRMKEDFERLEIERFFAREG